MTWADIGAAGGAPWPAGAAAEVRVLTNMVTPYVRVDLTLTGGVVTAEWWAMALGVVPLRRRRLVLPLERVSSLRARGVLFPARLVVALGLVAVLYLVSLPVWGSPWSGWGLWSFCCSASWMLSRCAMRGEPSWSPSASGSVAG